MTPRVTSDFWVGAYLARLRGAGVFAHVVARGDATAGAVAVKVADMAGKAALYMRSFDGTGTRVWTCLLDALAEAEIDQAIAKQRQFDRDLWVIEVEDPRGRHLLDEPDLG